MDAEDVRILLRLRADDIPGLVPRAVVDEYQLVGDLRTHRLGEGPDGDRDHLFFIVSRQDNREHIFSPFGLPVRDGTALARFYVDLGLSVIKGKRPLKDYMIRRTKSMAAAAFPGGTV